MLTRRDRLRNIVFAWFLLRHFRRALRQLRGRGIGGSLASFAAYLQRRAYGLFLRLPIVRTKVQLQVDDALKKLEDKLVQKGPGIVKYTELPRDGLADAAVRELLQGSVPPPPPPPPPRPPPAPARAC